ncbi:EAL domain-containing protein, partial [Acidobacteria bacterium ACD]|nr:EAL domain-containing protein [Acidobacteria bacterium ACD]
FKNINDTLGHETGDEFLKAAADRIRRCVRSGDTVARVGGDEFTVVVEGRPDDPRAAAVARNVIRALEEPIAVGSHRLYVGTSIGIAVHPGDGDDTATLVKNADAAMYLAKERGRGNYQFFTEALNQRFHRQLRLENRLRHALATGALDLHFQPLVDLRAGRVVGSEALLRWEDEELGRVPPSEFIPVAEETGLIAPIGETVLRRACQETKSLQAEGFADLRVSVNISARQFWQSDLAGSVAAALAESGLDGASLELELTESLLLPGSEDALAHLTALRALGVGLSLDDFGTGYSSLAMLRRLPFDSLKVAQEFVRDLSVDASDASIVRAILSMAGTLGFRVVAEGVETDEHVRFFRDSGCELAQGHFFSPAVPASEYREILRRGGFPAAGA